MKNVLVIHRTTWASNRDFLEGVFRFAAKSQNWNTRLVQPPEISEEEIIRTLKTEKIDGIIAAEVKSMRMMECLAGTAAPLVYTGPHAGILARRKNNTVFIVIDNVEIGNAGARYLLSLGRFRTFGYVPDPMPDAFWSEDRQTGFVRRIEAARFVPEIYPGQSPAGSSADRAELEAWIASKPKPIALMAAWDYRATQVMDACHAIGARIPEQVVVLGVDNDTLLCEFTRPHLSSVQPEHGDEGFRAARELARMMRARQPCKIKEIVCGMKRIVERETTRALSPAAHLVMKARAYIDRNACNGISFKDVVEHLGVSRRLVSLRFRELENTTVQEAIISRRVEEARRLLLETNDSIRIITQLCGFSNANRLKTLFKQRYGMTMREMRKRCSEE